MLWLLHWTALRVPQALWMQPHHRIFCRPGLLQVGRKQVASDKTTSSTSCSLTATALPSPLWRPESCFRFHFTPVQVHLQRKLKPKSSCILTPIPLSSDSQHLWEREQLHFPSFISGVQSRGCPRGRADVGCSCPQGSGSACPCLC